MNNQTETKDEAMNKTNINISWTEQPFFQDLLEDDIQIGQTIVDYGETGDKESCYLEIFIYEGSEVTDRVIWVMTNLVNLLNPNLTLSHGEKLFRLESDAKIEKEHDEKLAKGEPINDKEYPFLNACQFYFKPIDKTLKPTPEYPLIVRFVHADGTGGGLFKSEKAYAVPMKLNTSYFRF